MQQGQKREATKNQPAITIEPVLAEEAIDKKISFLQDLLAKYKVQEKDRGAVSNLISDYQKIREIQQSELSHDDYRNIIRILFQNLSLLDERYFSLQGQVNNESYAKAINDLYLKKEGILKKYLAKDYKAVISECKELETAFGADSLTFDAGILLAMSLAKEGRFLEAIDTSDKIIKDIEGRPDLIQLRAGLIEWRINTGKKEKALKEYEKLIKDMEERQSLFDKTTNKINSQDKNIEQSDQLLKDLLNEKANTDVNTRIANVMKEVNSLINQGDFAGAKILLLRWKLRTEDPLEIVQIDKALTSLDLSEKESQENLKNNTKEDIDSVTKLIEDEEYEPAIKMLELIKSRGDRNQDIDMLMNSAVEKLINKERNKAAKIFLTVKKTTDIKKKEELLVSAQDILSGLIEKYPSSDLIDKLKSNLNSVKDELKKIKSN